MKQSSSSLTSHNTVSSTENETNTAKRRRTDIKSFLFLKYIYRACNWGNWRQRGLRNERFFSLIFPASSKALFFLRRIKSQGREMRKSEGELFPFSQENFIIDFANKRKFAFSSRHVLWTRHLKSNRSKSSHNGLLTWFVAWLSSPERYRVSNCSRKMISSPYLRLAFLMHSLWDWLECLIHQWTQSSVSMGNSCDVTQSRTELTRDFSLTQHLNSLRELTRCNWLMRKWRYFVLLS